MVIDHDTGRLVWAAPGRDETTVECRAYPGFLYELSTDPTLVSDRTILDR